MIPPIIQFSIQSNLQTLIAKMWSNLPFDVLTNIFSFLPPDSLACADSACRNWHACARAYPLERPQTAWFVAMPSRTRQPGCYLHNPNINTWYFIRLDDVIHESVRPVASIGSLLLLRPAASPIGYLSVCNPFTKQVRYLPMFNRRRINPAFGVVTLEDSNFRIYLAGGMLEAPWGRGALYETTLEVYDSGDDKWRVVGWMPMELAVRLTVWTPNESVYSEGILYWMTSARIYTVMGFDIGRDRWHELSVPLGDLLEFASLVRHEGKVVLVGAVCGQSACVWVLGNGDVWGVISQVPTELGRRLVGVKLSWGNTKCVGIDGAICLYRDLGSGMVVWREMMEEKGRRWEWEWFEGCTDIKGKKRVQNYDGVRGLLLQPSRAPECNVKRHKDIFTYLHPIPFFGNRCLRYEKENCRAELSSDDVIPWARSSIKFKCAGKEWRKKQIRKITDKVFDRVTYQQGRTTLTFEELYIAAVLFVYNDINKHLPGPHFDPPPEGPSLINDGVM